MRLRIGEILVNRGVLTTEQCEQILERQQTQSRPFGVLAEEMFEVCPRILQDAWAEQFESVAPHVDPRREYVEPRASRLINRRQAWQFRMLPMRFESNELIVATTRAHLHRTLNFAYRHIGPTCSFVLAEPDALGEALQRHYPWQGPVQVRGSDLFAPTGYPGDDTPRERLS